MASGYHEEVKRPHDILNRIEYYSEKEELFNRWTHGIGALLSLVGAILLIQHTVGKGDVFRLVSVIVYGVALLVFYTLSTAYHSVKDPYSRYLFRILDHAAIYLMIAGSYTPFTLVTLRGPVGWRLFYTVWGLAAIGVIFKIFMTHKFRVLGPIFYLIMGWIVVVAIKPLSASLPPDGLKLLFTGGVTYTAGVIFYAWDRIPYNHAIWHLFVLSGSACHFLAIFYYVTPLHL
ncbi:PAQR family membrane homeostasis protein TrhA [Geomesophilobacter sediminis]|uniref:Hemolysin III family protein n=1 Tax=Geomesophilobacter sediminis TaxID=2798584 RepID=A0A8J7J0M8_9BACT|nr:hemolysin III family protein [Geomesophilobacter sediminis]MBJ6726167.1 hemolysin III family protein [Geomesophilobacter sediminis]